MSTLDNDFGYIDPSTVSPWSTALRYGGMASVILVIVALLIHLSGMSDYEAAAAGETDTLGLISQFLSYAVWIGAIVMAIKFHKNEELGGYITYGRGFYTGFATSVIMGLIGAIWAFVFFSFLAPEVLELMKEGALSQMGEDQAEQAEGMMDAMMSPGVMTGSVFAVTLFFGVIVSLIAAAVIKKEHPAA